MKTYIYSDPYPSNDPVKQQLKLDIQNNLKDTVTNPTKADLFIVLGGDGTMVRAIQKLKQYNKPFFGVNCGTLGFLLNDITSVDQIPESFEGLEQITEPFLEAHIKKTSGEIKQVLAVNDILINHDVSSSPKIKLTNPLGESININGSGAVISTPIGATGYRAGFHGPLLSTNNNELGIMGLGAGDFSRKQMIYSPQPYTIDINSRTPVTVRIDGKYKNIKGAQQIIYHPSQETFTLLFQKDADGRSFESKRSKLYAQKMGNGF